MEICTIGFTKRSAEEFFEALRRAGVQRVLDVRLRNDSQLAGFTRKRDLPYLLRGLVAAAYEHEPMLAPTEEMLRGYLRREISWPEYERRYLDLVGTRDVARKLDRSAFLETKTALLCSEREATRCHRRLAAEYLAQAWGDVTVSHL